MADILGSVQLQLQISDVRAMFVEPQIAATDLFMDITDGTTKPTAGQSCFLGICLIPDLYAYLQCSAVCERPGTQTGNYMY